MFTKIRKNLLNNNNIAILNNKIIVTIFVGNISKHILVLQQNAIWYIIN